MLDNFNKLRFKFDYTGEVGLPENYPIPREENLLFYIQRNLNINTVVYTLNLDNKGDIVEKEPIKVYWVNYLNGNERKRLNKIQNNLAFGYKSWKINNNTYKFQIVSYEKLDFYLTKDDTGKFRVFSMIDNQMTVINNVFVYAEQFGVFPQVKFIEFFGYSVEDSFPIYDKLVI